MMKKKYLMLSISLFCLVCQANGGTIDFTISTSLSTHGDDVPPIYRRPSSAPLPSDDYRIRVYASDNQINNIQLFIGTEEYPINRVNTEPFITSKQIFTQRLLIKFDDVSTSKSIIWNPDTVSMDPVSELKKFQQFLRTGRMSMQINNDPGMLFCLKKNQVIDVTIQYQYQANTYLAAEQQLLTYRCLIDNDGIINLPSFFEDINSNVNPSSLAAEEDVIITKGEATLSEGELRARNKKDNEVNNPDAWFDALTNSYKLKLIGDKECGIGSCQTYDAAERMITAFYLKRLSGQIQVKNIVFRISPPDFFTTVTVYHKNRAFTLPYQMLAVNIFFKQPLIRRIIGLKCNKSKVEIFSRCTISLFETMTRRTFKANKIYEKDLDTLKLGDIIYIK